MNEDVKNELKVIRALAEDNHRMLRAIRREAWLSLFGRLLFWALVILVPLYFLQPYLKLIPSGAELGHVIERYQATSTSVQ